MNYSDKKKLSNIKHKFWGYMERAFEFITEHKKQNTFLFS